MKITAIIFDFDGTLFDTEAFYCGNFVQTMKKYGVICDKDDIKYFHGLGPSEKIHYIEEKYNVIIDEKEAEDSYRKLNRDTFPPAEKLLFEDVIETLEYCKTKGYKLFICSNTDSYRVRELLEEAKISFYFDGISGKDMCKARKPSKVPYSFLLDHFGLRKEETVAIEDSSGGVYSAMAAGIQTIGLCRIMDPSELKADHCIKSLTELKELL